jgi:parvulin-like peptidyl-prolyl cis-trans isomerase-like protein
MRPLAHSNTGRLGLLSFGVALAVVFVVLALTEGVGDPSIPSGAVAVVEDTPAGTVEITKEQLDRSFDLVAVASNIDPPEPGDYQYEAVRNSALAGLIEGIWVPAQGEEMGFTQSEQELEDAVDKLKEQYSSLGYTKYLPADLRLKQADFEREARTQAFEDKTNEWKAEHIPRPSREEIEAYFLEIERAETALESGLALNGTLSSLGEVHLIRQLTNENREKLEQARRQLQKDNSPKSWDAAASEFSEDPDATLVAVRESDLEEPLKSAVFESGSSYQIEGPIKTSDGFVVFELDTILPSLKDREKEIKETLRPRLKEEFTEEFSNEYKTKWQSRTFCAPGYVTEQCSNFPTADHLESAPSACYEEDPAAGRPEVCPAPVPQLAPAIPGTVSPLFIHGIRLPQRAQPGPPTSGEKAEQEQAEAEQAEGNITTSMP